MCNKQVIVFMITIATSWLKITIDRIFIQSIVGEILRYFDVAYVSQSVDRLQILHRYWLDFYILRALVFYSLAHSANSIAAIIVETETRVIQAKHLSIVLLLLLVIFVILLE